MPIQSLPRPPRRMSGAMWTLERIVDPTFEPIDLEAMKKHLRAFADATDEDDEVQEQFYAAREWAEEYTGHALVDQKWRLTIDIQNGLNYQGSNAIAFDRVAGCLPFNTLGEILLRKSPILEITSFVSIDQAGTETEIDANSYALCDAQSRWPRLARVNGATWLPGCLRVEFRAGYVDKSGDTPVGTVPRRFMQAIKLYAEALYDRDPQMMSVLMKTAEDLLNPVRSELSLA
jgi:hypothetical protein